VTAKKSHALLDTLVIDLTEAGWCREEERHRCPNAIDHPKLLLASPDGATHLHAAVSKYGHLESILCARNPDGAYAWSVGTGALEPRTVLEAARAATEQPDTDLDTLMYLAGWGLPGQDRPKEHRIDKEWYSPDGARELKVFCRPGEPGYYAGHLQRPDRVRPDGWFEFDAVPGAVIATLALADSPGAATLADALLHLPPLPPPTNDPQITAMLQATVTMLSNAVGYPVTLAWAPPGDEDEALDEDGDFEDEDEEELADEDEEGDEAAGTSGLSETAAFAKEWTRVLTEAGWTHRDLEPRNAGQVVWEMTDPTGRYTARADYDNPYVASTGLRPAPEAPGGRPAGWAHTGLLPATVLLAAVRAAAEAGAGTDAGGQIGERLLAAGWNLAEQDFDEDGLIEQVWRTPDHQRWAAYRPEHPASASGWNLTRDNLHPTRRIQTSAAASTPTAVIAALALAD
jgi:hypothetical protein